MDSFEIENIYRAAGLNNLQLGTVDDLLKVHKIDCKSINGYNKLNDVNRNLYEKFIINFFNKQGLKCRVNLIPKTIYYVHEHKIRYLRFEYELEGKLECLNVRSETSWS